MNIVVVDGYNIIGAWEELERLKKESINGARDKLIEIMAEYQAYSGLRVIIVFDAYNVPGLGRKERPYQLEIIYTKEKETADECIERIVKGLKNVQNQVYVATSDFAEQRTIFSRGALRISARELYMEWLDRKRQMDIRIDAQRKVKPQSRIPLDKETLEMFEKWRRGEYD